MSTWPIQLELGGDADQPIFLRLARAISEDVQRGRLKPGDALPGSRTLARALGVHRNTVLAAYNELAAEGWITTAEAAGTFVSPALPTLAPRRGRSALPARLGFDLHRGQALVWPPRSDGFLFSSGVPDVRLVPAATLARAYRRALARHGPALLGYGDTRGHERLRAALGGMLSALRGVAAEDGLMVTRGSQLALDLVARALLVPGDVIAVEALGYRPAWAAFAGAGARLVPIPVDEHGLCVDALAELADKKRVRAVYVTPHHQYPTMVTMSAERRLRLLALARARRIAVIEDDYDFEFHYEGSPVLPLASADRDGVVVYIGTLSKILAPSLRLGFVVAPPPLLEHLTHLRRAVDGHGDQVVECAVAELIEDGEVQRHARRVRRIYQARRDALVECLRRRLGGVLSFAVPPGGMALWARADAAVDVDAWATRALERGVNVSTARRFSFEDRASPALRLAFAPHTEAELDDGVKRLAKAL